MRKTAQLTKEAAFDQRGWHVVDVAGLPIGRAATMIATLLRGKHKPNFTPNTDCGDFVVVINAAKVGFTGKKYDEKLYYRHTGFPGGLVAQPPKKIMEKHPDEPIRRAVWGMLPKGPLGRKLYRKLKVYAGAEHPHGAQQPQATSLAPIAKH
jgi:large subunit ribosomal protein L13